MTESSGSLGMKKGMERQETRIIKEHEEISEGFRFVHLHIRIPKFIKWYILNVNYILTNFFFFYKSITLLTVIYILRSKVFIQSQFLKIALQLPKVSDYAHSQDTNMKEQILGSFPCKGFNVCLLQLKKHCVT